jgi:probable F420-dependent oxidoreductase
MNGIDAWLRTLVVPVSALMCQRGEVQTFRFGVEMKQPFDGMSWADSARELEAMGYDTLFVPDHLHSPMGPISAMAFALAATSRLVVAPLVLACDLRNPAVLAKELCTLHELSGGRLEVGLGAGYNPLDYSRSGILMPSPGDRVSNLIEQTQLLRAVFESNGQPVSFRGARVNVDDLPSMPSSTVAGPRILIGGGGRRVLSHAARTADIVGVNPTTAAGRDDPATFRDALPESIDRKFELVRTAAGARFEQLEFNAWVSWASVTNDARSQAKGLADWVGCTADELLDSPLVLVGSEAEIVQRLRGRRERWGYTYTCIPQDQARAFASIVAAISG